MFVNVTKDNVIVDEDSFETHQGEYNVTTCYFTFSEEFNSLVKIACFTINSTNETYKIDIVDNECIIPAEVLEKEFETITLGVYGYAVDQSDNLELRYSPTSFDFYVERGSYKEGGETPEIITPTQYELYSQALEDGLEEASYVDIDVEKVDTVATVTITNRHNEEKSVEIYDGGSVDLTNYVKNTDYATDSVGGVVKIENAYGVLVENGSLRGYTRTYSQYGSSGNKLIISKGTLEEVLNARIGDISSVIDSINGEVI